MKKLIAFITVLVVAVALAACAPRELAENELKFVGTWVSAADGSKTLTLNDDGSGADGSRLLSWGVGVDELLGERFVLVYDGGSTVQYSFSLVENGFILHTDRQSPKLYLAEPTRSEPLAQSVTAAVAGHWSCEESGDELVLLTDGGGTAKVTEGDGTVEYPLVWAANSSLMFLYYNKTASLFDLAFVSDEEGEAGFTLQRGGETRAFTPYQPSATALETLIAVERWRCSDGFSYSFYEDGSGAAFGTMPVQGGDSDSAEADEPEYEDVELNFTWQLGEWFEGRYNMLVEYDYGLKLDLTFLFGGDCFVLFTNYEDPRLFTAETLPAELKIALPLLTELVLGEWVEREGEAELVFNADYSGLQRVPAQEPDGEPVERSFAWRATDNSYLYILFEGERQGRVYSIAAEGDIYATSDGEHVYTRPVQQEEATK